MQGLEHRLSIKQCIRRTQGSVIETGCVPLERDFMLSGGQRYWARARAHVDSHRRTTFIIQWTLQEGRIVPAGDIFVETNASECPFPAPYLEKKNVVLVFKRHAVIKQFCVFGRHLSGTETWFKSSVTHTNISLSWLILFLSSLSASSFLSMCPCVAYLSNQPQICEVMSLILFFVWNLLLLLLFFYRIWKSSIEKSATNIRSL